MQSLSYALKLAGAVSVVAVVLGRLVKPEYEPSRQLLTRVAETPFDMARCCQPSCGPAV